MIILYEKCGEVYMELGGPMSFRDTLICDACIPSFAMYMLSFAIQLSGQQISPNSKQDHNDQVIDIPRFLLLSLRIHLQKNRLQSRLEGK